MNTQFCFNLPGSTLSCCCLLAVGFLGVVALSGPGFAQTLSWPTKPVRIITGWTPGGPEEFRTYIQVETMKKRQLAARIGIKSE